MCIRDRGYLGMANIKDPGKVWNKACTEIQNELNPGLYSAWIKPLKLNSITEDDKLLTAEFSAPSAFSQKFIKNNYGEIIHNSLGKTLGTENIKISFTSGVSTNNKEGESRSFSPVINSVFTDLTKKVSLNDSNISSRRTSTSIKRNTKKSYLNCKLNKNYNFSNFVIGGCNQFAPVSYTHLTLPTICSV